MGRITDDYQDQRRDRDDIDRDLRVREEQEPLRRPVTYTRIPRADRPADPDDTRVVDVEAMPDWTVRP